MAIFPQSHQDFLKAEVAMLATIEPDGYSQVRALRFLFDEDDTIKLSLNTSRQKEKNLQAHLECTFFVLDTSNPYRTLACERGQRSSRMQTVPLRRNWEPNMEGRS